MAKLPEYRDKILQDSAGDEAEEENLFFHLGYWPEPENAESSLSDLISAQVRLNDLVIEQASLSEGMRVLDVGCGVGGTIAALGSDDLHLQLFGLNVDLEQLRLARARVGMPPAWVGADAVALPFAAESFDCLVALECVFHFSSRAVFFEEAKRVLRPGGRLVLTDFVVRKQLRDLRSSDPRRWEGIVEEICKAVGPWPEFWWSPNFDGAAMTLIERRDISLQTLPSYRCFLDSEPIENEKASAGLRPIDRASALMEMLQAQGLLAMEVFVFVR